MQTDATTDAPAACTLLIDQLQQPLALIRRVTASSLLSHEVSGTTLRLRYRLGAGPHLERIAAGEHECCPFMSFTLMYSPAGVDLVIRSMAEVDGDARWLFDQFLPQPMSVTGTPPFGCAARTCG